MNRLKKRYSKRKERNTAVVGFELSTTLSHAVGSFIKDEYLPFARFQRPPTAAPSPTLSKDVTSPAEQRSEGAVYSAKWLEQ